MLSLPPAVKLWYCPEPTDMRLGFDGLFALVQSRRGADPLAGHRFIFRNQNADRLKVLDWGGHGRCRFGPRREAGRYHFPDAPADAQSVAQSVGPFPMIRDGIDLSRVRRFQRFTPPR